jgi:hypothetical protein
MTDKSVDRFLCKALLLFDAFGVCVENGLCFHDGCACSVALLLSGLVSSQFTFFESDLSCATLWS